MVRRHYTARDLDIPWPHEEEEKGLDTGSDSLNQTPEILSPLSDCNPLLKPGGECFSGRFAANSVPCPFLCFLSCRVGGGDLLLFNGW